VAVLQAWPQRTTIDVNLDVVRVSGLWRRLRRNLETLIEVCSDFRVKSVTITNNKTYGSRKSSDFATINDNRQ